MQEKDQIAELFKDAFENYEEAVNPELWGKISSSINSVPTTPPTTPGVVESSVNIGTSLFSSVSTWIAGAAIVASTVAGYYYFSDQPNPVESLPSEVPTQIQENNNLIQSTTPTVQTGEKNAGTGVNWGNTDEKTTSSLHNNVSTADKSSNHSEEASLSEKWNSTNENAVNTESTLLSSAPSVVSNSSSVPSSNTSPNMSPESINNNAGENKSESIKLRAFPESGTAPLAVNFTYDGNAEKVEWIFGDGNTANNAKMKEHVFENPGTYTVTLKVHDLNGQISYKNILIEVAADLFIKFVPNIFTPNNDGINDRFTFDISKFIDYEVFIYDQSGKFINKWSTPVDGWDGKYNSGKEAPEGTYIYIIFATAENQQKHQQKGTITLKR